MNEFSREVNKTLILASEPIEQYVENHTTAEDPILQELDRQTHLRVVQPRMLSGHVQGKILEMLSKMIRPMSILEIGTFTGYSAICLAKGLAEGGILHTIEINDELESIANQFIDRSYVGTKITQHIGSALEIAPILGVSFDLVFLDGDKREYVDYYNMLFDNKIVHSGSYILADNILWSGKVVEPLQSNDLHTKRILEFNTIVVNDDRVETVILPLRDGMSIIRVK